MKIYNAIGVQFSILALILFGASIVAMFAKDYYNLYVAVLVLVSLFAPSPYHEWRESEIHKEVSKQ